MTSPVALDPELETDAEPGKGEQKLEGRSPGQLMWIRFKRDRTGVISRRGSHLLLRGLDCSRR